MPEKKKNILLIEDEPLLGALLKQKLEKSGFDVTLLRDGAQALEYLKANKPDLVLLDIILPKISGFELMEKIQSDSGFQSPPIIIVSNLGQDSDIKKGEKLGAVGYFVKARISMEDLVEKVARFLRE